MKSSLIILSTILVLSVVIRAADLTPEEAKKLYHDSHQKVSTNDKKEHYLTCHVTGDPKLVNE